MQTIRTRHPALFTNQSEHWATPGKVYEALNGEFGFTLDPCPLDHNSVSGLTMDWSGERVYCNPPYGPGIEKWLRKSREAEIAVYLLPARTDTKWWHTWAVEADEVRFIRGRLKFGGAKFNAPFPSVVLVFRNKK